MDSGRRPQSQKELAPLNTNPGGRPNCENLRRELIEPPNEQNDEEVVDEAVTAAA